MATNGTNGTAGTGGNHAQGNAGDKHSGAWASESAMGGNYAPVCASGRIAFARFDPD